MTDDHVASAVAWFQDGWNNRNEEVFDEMLTDTTIGHVPTGEMDPSQFKSFYRAFVAMMPDLKVTVESAATVDDVVAVRWRVQGTHTGEIDGCAPTGKPIEFAGSTWFRYGDGDQVMEAWDHWNAQTVFEQLGWQPQVS